MSRFGKQTAYGKHVQKIAHDHYRLSWVRDFYYPSSNLRHPRTFHRDTDERGAVRFAKKWNIEMPASQGAT